MRHSPFAVHVKASGKGSDETFLPSFNFFDLSSGCLSEKIGLNIKGVGNNVGACVSGAVNEVACGAFFAVDYESNVCSTGLVKTAEESGKIVGNGLKSFGADDKELLLFDVICGGNGVCLAVSVVADLFSKSFEIL